jgi:hypothetical protein
MVLWRGQRGRRRFRGEKSTSSGAPPTSIGFCPHIDSSFSNNNLPVIPRILIHFRDIANSFLAHKK